MSDKFPVVLLDSGAMVLRQTFPFIMEVTKDEKTGMVEKKIKWYLIHLDCGWCLISEPEQDSLRYTLEKIERHSPWAVIGEEELKGTNNTNVFGFTALNTEGGMARVLKKMVAFDPGWSRPDKGDERILNGTCTEDDFYKTVCDMYRDGTGAAYIDAWSAGERSWYAANAWSELECSTAVCKSRYTHIRSQELAQRMAGYFENGEVTSHDEPMAETGSDFTFYTVRDATYDYSYHLNPAHPKDGKVSMLDRFGPYVDWSSYKEDSSALPRGSDDWSVLSFCIMYPTRWAHRGWRCYESSDYKFLNYFLFPAPKKVGQVDSLDITAGLSIDGGGCALYPYEDSDCAILRVKKSSPIMLEHVVFVPSLQSLKDAVLNYVAGLNWYGLDIVSFSASCGALWGEDGEPISPEECLRYGKMASFPIIPCKIATLLETSDGKFFAGSSSTGFKQVEKECDLAPEVWIDTFFGKDSGIYPEDVDEKLCAIYKVVDGGISTSGSQETVYTQNREKIFYGKGDLGNLPWMAKVYQKDANDEYFKRLDELFNKEIDNSAQISKRNGCTGAFKKRYVKQKYYEDHAFNIRALGTILLDDESFPEDSRTLVCERALENWAQTYYTMAGSDEFATFQYSIVPMISLENGGSGTNERRIDYSMHLSDLTSADDKYVGAGNWSDLIDMEGMYGRGLYSTDPLWQDGYVVYKNGDNNAKERIPNKWIYNINGTMLSNGLTALYPLGSDESDYMCATDPFTIRLNALEYESASVHGKPPKYDLVYLSFGVTQMIKEYSPDEGNYRFYKLIKKSTTEDDGKDDTAFSPNAGIYKMEVGTPRSGSAPHLRYLGYGAKPVFTADSSVFGQIKLTDVDNRFNRRGYSSEMQGVLFVEETKNIYAAIDSLLERLAYQYEPIGPAYYYLDDIVADDLYGRLAVRSKIMCVFTIEKNNKKTLYALCAVKGISKYKLDPKLVVAMRDNTRSDSDAGKDLSSRIESFRIVRAVTSVTGKVDEVQKIQIKVDGTPVFFKVSRAKDGSLFLKSNTYVVGITDEDKNSYTVTGYQGAFVHFFDAVYPEKGESTLHFLFKSASSILPIFTYCSIAPCVDWLYAGIGGFKPNKLPETIYKSAEYLRFVGGCVDDLHHTCGGKNVSLLSKPFTTYLGQNRLSIAYLNSALVTAHLSRLESLCKIEESPEWEYYGGDWFVGHQFVTKPVFGKSIINSVEDLYLTKVTFGYDTAPWLNACKKIDEFLKGICDTVKKAKDLGWYNGFHTYREDKGSYETAYMRDTGTECAVGMRQVGVKNHVNSKAWCSGTNLYLESDYPESTSEWTMGENPANPPHMDFSFEVEHTITCTDDYGRSETYTYTEIIDDLWNDQNGVRYIDNAIKNYEITV